MAFGALMGLVFCPPLQECNFEKDITYDSDHIKCVTRETDIKVSYLSTGVSSSS